jgi:hypothetical protein
MKALMLIFRIKKTNFSNKKNNNIFIHSYQQFKSLFPFLEIHNPLSKYSISLIKTKMVHYHLDKLNLKYFPLI